MSETKPKRRWLRFSLRTLFIMVTILGVCVAFVSFASRWFKARITVENKSQAMLVNVVVSGKGFSESLGTIDAGATANTWVSAKGDTGITVDFDLGGKHYSSGEQEYIAGMGGERFTATIEQDLQIHVVRDH
jgi:hypothetical protein